MTLRFATWTDIGTHTFVPEDDTVDIGEVTLLPEADTIWVRITTDNPIGPWPWSYGILGWRSVQGFELGTMKAYSDQLGSISQLTVGLEPEERTGILTFRPRSFNLAWAERGDPWTLNFEARSGNSFQGAPALGTRATVIAFADLEDAAVEFRFDDFARIALT